MKILKISLLVLLPTLALAQEPAPPAEGLPLPTLLAVALGVVAPPLIQFLTNRLTSRTGRFAMALLLSAVAGGIAYGITRPPITDAVDVIAYTFGTAQTAYMLFWRPLWDSPAKLFGLGEIRKIKS